MKKEANGACGGQGDAAGVLPLPASTCPLCGGPNACAPAQCGSFDVPCWCSSVHIPPEVLARVPAELQGKACVCAKCAGVEASGGGAR